MDKQKKLVVSSGTTIRAASCPSASPSVQVADIAVYMQERGRPTGVGIPSSGSGALCVAFCSLFCASVDVLPCLTH